MHLYVRVDVRLAGAVHYQRKAVWLAGEVEIDIIYTNRQKLPYAII